jgi:hypothetical protein
MSEVRHCGIAAETKVETPEGPMTIRACAGKAIPVLTRNDESAVLFRMMLDVRKVADGHPVLKVTLENGESFRIAPEQIMVQADQQTVAASGLRAGIALLPAFHYPPGYNYRSDGGSECVSDRALKVVKVEPAGTAEVYALGVNQTGCFFLAAGVLCRAED